MTRSIWGIRRAAALLAGGAAATLLVSGCGAGQIAETAAKASSVPGVNIESQDGSVAIRNLQVAYPGTEGYPTGGEAPITMAIYNQTNDPVSVRVTTTPVQDSDEQASVVWGRDVVLTGSRTSTSTPSPTGATTPGSTSIPATPSATASGAPTASGATPTASAAPTAPAGRQAVIDIPALGSVILTTAGTELLKVVGLNDALMPGKAVNLTFEFSNGAPALTVAAPTGVPLSPAPRATPSHEGVEGGTGEGH